MNAAFMIWGTEDMSRVGTYYTWLAFHTAFFWLSRILRLTPYGAKKIEAV